MNDKDFEKLVFGMAHQIRNPCAIIKANANLLLQKPDLQPASRHSLDAIVNGVKYLQDRLEEFVEFSKPLPLKLQPVPVKRLLSDLVGMLREKCDLQKTRISCNNVDQQLVLNQADHQHLLLALVNVALNAIEAITEGGAITIEAQRVGEKISIIVKDTGIGIHPRDLPEVFSPFYSTKVGGIGIGLAVTKRIVDAHNGTIEVQSSQGKGTVVTIELP